MKHPLSALVAFILVALLGLAGGAGASLDRDIVLWWAAWRASSPRGTEALVVFTQLGSAPALLALGGGALGLLLVRRQWPAAIAFAATVLGGRAAIEGLKWAVARPRPGYDAHPVVVQSNSFPSAHAGNSMLTLLAIALWVVPLRWRGPALAAALVLSAAIGASRPMLGVHWPSDVAAGWLFGLGWVALGWSLSRRGRSEA